jgi:hypothetical protein
MVLPCWLSQKRSLSADTANSFIGVSLPLDLFCCSLHANLVVLEILHGTLMSVGGFPGGERAEIAATPGFRILFARI